MDGIGRSSVESDGNIIVHQAKWNRHRVPEMNEDLLRLFGYTLAYGHYYYEREAGLKNLNHEAMCYGAREGVSIEYVRKLILVNINVGCVEANLEITDMTRGLAPVKEDVAATRDRKYRSAVYKHKINASKRPYYICESPSCLDLFRMIRKAGSGGALELTQGQCRTVFQAFAEMLQTLLCSNVNCVRQFRIYCGEFRWLHDFLIEHELRSSCEPLRKLDRRINDFRNIGFVLAVQYYYNYILRIMPSLRRRMQEYEREQFPSGTRRMIPQMIVVVPASGYVSDQMRDDLQPDSIRLAGKLPTYTCTLGLTRRDYRASIYKIRTRKITNFYCYVEFATPVRQMKKMNDEREGNLEDVFTDEIESFAFWCQNLIDHNNHGELVSIAFWDDRREKEENDNDDLKDDETYKTLTDLLEEYALMA